MITLVLDTNFWEEAASCSISDALSLLHKIKSDQSLTIGLDHENNIMNEYMNRRCNKFIQLWIYNIFGKKPSGLNYQSSDLDNKIELKLKILKFDTSDLPFVGLALNTSKCIVTEDSDYGKGHNLKAKETSKQAVLDYLTTTLQMKLYNFNEAYKKFCQA